MKVAILGMGSAGRRHAQNLAELGHEVVVFDPEVEARAFATASEEAAIHSSDAVVVASPNAFHADQAIAALDAGRHVLVEKPLSTTAADALRIAEVAHARGRICGVAMNLRFHPAIVALRRLAEQGTLGTIHLAEAFFGYDLRLWRPSSDYRRSYSGRAELGGGIVLDAIHELDYLLWLLGPVDAVTGEVAHVSDLEVDVEDVAVGCLRFASGALATVSLNFFEPTYRRGCLLVGSAAVARWEWSNDAVVVEPRDGTVTRIAISADVDQTYKEVVRDFIEAIEAERTPRTPVADGVAAVRLAEALKAASRGGRRVRVH